ncbi:hypothetical protein NX059_002835 [Plenodomus lindquistii]|nr:hypothetical protein NX059_002835 [Plenodomus lindquistii]
MNAVPRPTENTAVVHNTISRISKACSACRRKKIKCDGQQPCHTCSSRDHSCEYAESNDNAYASRQYNTSFEARCLQMDAMCLQLDSLAGRLSQAIEALNASARLYQHGTHGREQSADSAGFPTVTNALQFSEEHHQPQPGSSDVPNGTESTNGLAASQSQEQRASDVVDDVVSDYESDPESCVDDVGSISKTGALVRDSYGGYRFIGGAANMMLLEAIEALTPDNPATTSTIHGYDPQANSDSDHVELPFFLPGSVWPSLPFLPKPEELSRPPQYVADLLIGLYFDRLHYTFPVVFKPEFLLRYRQLYRSGPDNISLKDRNFLMVFFAICACASSLLPSMSGNQLTGVEHYEKALLLYYASTGEACIERAQCMALLALCAAGWNTLSQSWMLAGQAVRASMEIGIHLSGPLNPSANAEYEMPDSNEVLRRQISRRLWWSIYTIDRIMSICLGRPTAAHDEDCYCVMPLNVHDDELQASSTQTEVERDARHSERKASSPLTGFLAFVRLCRIAGKVQSLSSPHCTRQLAFPNSTRLRKVRARATKYEKALRGWLDNLPDEFRFSANAVETNPPGDPGLTMCVIAFIVHSGSLLSLYRFLVTAPMQTSSSPSSEPPATDAMSHCRSAAKSCINAAELVLDLVPPSHYLAICVHYLTLSGVVLLRLPPSYADGEIVQYVEKCIRFLKDLEQRWSGASRSRVIIEQLLVTYRHAAPTHVGVRAAEQQSVSRPQPSANKRTFADFEDITSVGENTLWRQFYDPDLFGFDFSAPVLLGSEIRR